MRNPIIISVNNEIIKLVKNKYNFLYILVTGVFIVSIFSGIEFLSKEKYIKNTYSNLIITLQSFTNILLPFILLAYSSTSISAECSSGNIRNIFISNISRKYFIISKFFVCFLFEFAIMLMAAVLAIFIGWYLFGFGEIAEEGFLIMSKLDFWSQFAFSYLLLIVVYLSLISFGIFISSIIHNNIGAITISIGIYLILETIKNKLPLENFLFTTSFEFPLDILAQRIEGFATSFFPQLYNVILASSIWAIVFMFAAYVVIKRIELK